MRRFRGESGSRSEKKAMMQKGKGWVAAVIASRRPGTRLPAIPSAEHSTLSPSPSVFLLFIKYVRIAYNTPAVCNL